MTITTDLADMTREDLLAAVDHFVKRIGEVVTEAEATKKQLARVQRHVLVVDAVNQAHEREIAELKTDNRRLTTRNHELAIENENLRARREQDQQEPRTVRRSIWSSHSRQL